MSEPQNDEAHTSNPIIKSSAADKQNQVGIITPAAVQIKTEASTVYEKTDGIQYYDTMLDDSKPQTPVRHSSLSTLINMTKFCISTGAISSSQG